MDGTKHGKIVIIFTNFPHFSLGLLQRVLVPADERTTGPLGLLLLLLGVPSPLGAQAEKPSRGKQQFPKCSPIAMVVETGQREAGTFVVVGAFAPGAGDCDHFLIF